MCGERTSQALLSFRGRCPVINSWRQLTTNYSSIYLISSSDDLLYDKTYEMKNKDKGTNLAINLFTLTFCSNPYHVVSCTTRLLSS